MPHGPSAMSEEYAEDLTPRVMFRFNKGQMPESVKDVKVEMDVIVTVRGKVCGIQEDEYGGSVEVKFTEFKLLDADEAPKSMQKVLEELAIERRKR